MKPNFYNYDFYLKKTTVKKKEMTTKTELQAIYKKLVNIFMAYYEHEFSFDATTPDDPEEAAKGEAKRLMNVIEKRSKTFRFVTRENQDHAQSAEQYRELFEITKLMSDKVYQLLSKYSINWITFKENITPNGLYHNGFRITLKKQTFSQDQLDHFYERLLPIFKNYYEQKFGFRAMDHEWDTKGMTMKLIDVIQGKRGHIHFQARENEGGQEFQTEKYDNILHKAFQKFIQELTEFLNYHFGQDISIEETSPNYQITISTVD